MSSGMLEKARAYEKRKAQEIRSDQRPRYHLSPCCGWMNDPNGFSFYQGKYHLFYQYYPYEACWGLMHWGHAVSPDLLHWEYLPCALAPDQPYDRDGCFSGSAWTLPDGRQGLFYTGVEKADESQVQCLAVGDGVDYLKYEGNPVIDGSMLPEGAAASDFRDPKIFPGRDGGYHLIVSARDTDGSGQILLYESRDAFHWEFASVLIKNDRSPGVMWECPDLFSIGEKDVLLVSPMDGMPEALIGRFDRERKVFYPESVQTLDPGPDFYAPQTVLAPDGRRLLIAWMQNWKTVDRLDPSAAWVCQMTLPREVTYEDGRLCLRPLTEAQSFGERAEGDKVVFRDRYSIEIFSDEGECLKTKALTDQKEEP